MEQRIEENLGELADLLSQSIGQNWNDSEAVVKAMKELKEAFGLTTRQTAYCFQLAKQNYNS